MKIGSYTIPNNRLRTLIEDAKKVYEKFPNEEVEAEFIAHTLDNSPTSGAFKQKLADLRSYGLLEGRGKIRISELGKKVTYGHEDEKREAFEKIIKNIPLWGIFFDKYGVSIKEDNFWVDLAKITGLERPESQNKAEWVRKAYLDDVRYYKPVEKAQESGLGQENQPERVPMSIDRRETQMETQQFSQNTINAIGYIGFPEYSKAPIEIKDELSYNIAKQLLEAIGNKLKEKTKEVTGKTGE
jgi:hypothetical protein